MELFLETLRKSNPYTGGINNSTTGVEAMRISAKGLVNLVSNRRDLRL
jgi:hypothetical protein